MKYLILAIFVVACASPYRLFAATVAITMDNPNTYSWPLYSVDERDQEIRQALKRASIKIGIFAAGFEVDSTEGKLLLGNWDADGHIIGNHTYSHKSYNSSSWSFERYSNDILKNEPIISGFKNFKKYFRFVMLKEGDTADKRDRLRAFFEQHGYRNVPVTIDASDWYIDLRLRQKLEKDPKADLKRYRDYYLAHIWDRAQFYDQLAREVTGREVKHTLLIHHNLLNALFLGDLINMFKAKGWSVVDFESVLNDPVLSVQTTVLPAGESIIWSMAKATGKHENELRYPGENDSYEKPAMDRLGL
ncbi:MAG TPA: polysaccharide deacetylase family protein [Bdellovibrionota bacterium]|nr:polysaccharide deacetylase family protein [Bdellovibrionota bacterium]